MNISVFHTFLLSSSFIWKGFTKPLLVFIGSIWRGELIIHFQGLVKIFLHVHCWGLNISIVTTNKKVWRFFVVDLSYQGFVLISIACGDPYVDALLFGICLNVWITCTLKGLPLNEWFGKSFVYYAVSGCKFGLLCVFWVNLCTSLHVLHFSWILLPVQKLIALAIPNKPGFSQGFGNFKSITQIQWIL